MSATRLYHAERHVVSNFMVTIDMRIDVGMELTLAPYDSVVVSSDGLSDNVHPDEVIERVRTGKIDKALRRVVDLALHRMENPDSAQPSKPDDLSVVVFRKGGARKRKSAARTTEKAPKPA